ncbi:MAG: glycosyltransferase [Lachnospiraceae bacterium]|nr:glycosyltransferase [Lachnospiraceae bacterium]
MKEVLFVINTLGRAGAETAFLELLKGLDTQKIHVSLYVLMNQGEMVQELPEGVKLLNKQYKALSVLSREGKKILSRQVWRAMFTRMTVIRLFPYLLKHFMSMLLKHRVLPDKLLWRVMSDGGQVINNQYDLAVAFLEGGSAYYVADHVKAVKKAAFIHVDYQKAGYTRKLDNSCYLKYDKIFTVSGEVRDAFLEVYPECKERAEIFHNMIDRDKICSMAALPGGFVDDFEGWRILTVGRLTEQKALEFSIDAMKRLKDEGLQVKWYVLGEGERRSFLEERVRKLGLEEDFMLFGAVENPYPYMLQADLYVHASRFEGKSLAIQEAQILGKAVLVSDCNGNREQVEQNVDGMMCALTPEGIAEGIKMLLEDEEKRERLGKAAALKETAGRKELDKIYSLL